MARQHSVFTLADIEEMIKNFENMIVSGEPELIRNTLGKYIVFYVPPAEASPGRRLKVVQNE
jgi:hypothetical protein